MFPQPEIWGLGGVLHFICTLFMPLTSFVLPSAAQEDQTFMFITISGPLISLSERLSMGPWHPLFPHGLHGRCLGLGFRAGLSSALGSCDAGWFCSSVSNPWSLFTHWKVPSQPPGASGIDGSKGMRLFCELCSPFSVSCLRVAFIRPKVRRTWGNRSDHWPPGAWGQCGVG